MTADTDASATDDTTTDEPPATGDSTTDRPEQRPGDVTAMEAALKKANKESEQHRKRIKELEDKDKSELQRTTDERDEHKTARTAAELTALRLEVALDKGLTATQAKRLLGSTREELESDAEELVASFTPAEDDDKKPARRPTERLRGGGAPQSEPDEMDPRKLADQIPRRGF